MNILQNFLNALHNGLRWLYSETHQIKVTTYLNNNMCLNL